MKNKFLKGAILSLCISAQSLYASNHPRNHSNNETSNKNTPSHGALEDSIEWREDGRIFKTMTRILSKQCSEKRENHRAIAKLLQELLPKELWQRRYVIKPSDVTPEIMSQLSSYLLTRAKEKTPKVYEVGRIQFCGIPFTIKQPVFVPMDATMHLTRCLCHAFGTLGAEKYRNIRILDVCCGSGCIGLTLAKTLEASKLVGLDISDVAISLARENSKLLEVRNAHFKTSDVLDALDESKDFFDVIVCNPPYLAQEDWLGRSLDERSGYDPASYWSEDDGFAVTKKLINQAPKFLRVSDTFTDENMPQLVFHLSQSQVPRAKKLLVENGFTDIEVYGLGYTCDLWIQARLGSNDSTE